MSVATEPLEIAVRGAVGALAPRERTLLLVRSASGDPVLRQRTRDVIQRVREGGDTALRAMAREFDHVTVEALEVPRRAWDDALARLDPSLRGALERSAANVRAVHEAFRPVGREVTTPDGIRVGRRPDPLGRVGVYAPGGRAVYPSSLLMGAVPARVVGVGEVVVCSPPTANGTPAAVVLAAAAIAGVDRVFAIGGAGAIAAMAYGTPTVAPVDRIVGPGNAYVAEAKLQVSHVVSIDSPAGPSELLVIADETASPPMLASEMLAQAEHDPAAAVVLLALSSALAEAVFRELELRIADAPRATVIRAALASRGALLTVSSLDEALAFASEWAAEHLVLALAPAARELALDRVRNAGAVFLGDAPSVVFGDYLTGANHVLPTGGLARIFSGLSTDDFVRWTSWQRIDRAAARAMSVDVATLAEAEGLPSHAAASRQWEEA